MDIDLLVPRRKPVGPVKINMKHPMGKGITACWLFQDRDGNEIIDLSGRQETGQLEGAVFGRNERGNRILQTTDTQLATVPNYDHSPIGSCIVRARRTVDDGSRQRVLGFADEFEFNINTSDKWGNDFYQAGSSNTPSTINADVGEWYTIICGWNRTTNDSRIVVKRDLGGREVFTFGSNANDTPAQDHPILTFGNRTGAADNEAFKGDIEFIIFKDYVVNRSEVVQWAHNAYQFLEPDYASYPLFITPQTGLTQDQSAFRWYNDNDVEADATPIAAQDVNITQPGSTPAILRFQVSNTGDAPSQQMTVQVKKTADADSTYRDIPVAD